MKRVTIFSTVTTLVAICFFILVASGKNCDECFSLPVMMIKFFTCGVVIFIGSLHFMNLYMKMEKIIFNIETLPLLETNEATPDVPFSCEGWVSVDEKNLLSSPYANKLCVYYHSITEEYKQRGKHSRWEVVENLVRYVPFYITDTRGKLKIDLTNMDADFSGHALGRDDWNIPDPDMSEIDSTTILKHAKYSTSKPFLGFISTSASRRRSEFILEPSQKIFAYGYITRQKGELVLHEHTEHPLLISKKTKDAYVNEFYKGKHLIFFAHLLLSVGFTISLYSINYFLTLPPLFFTTIVLLGNLGIGGSIILTMYNRIITLKQRSLVALSTIDIEIKRRTELIPNIIRIIKEYTGYEKEIFQQTAAMRVKMVQNDHTVGVKQVDTQKLLALVEGYPELKASQNYQHLMITLVDTEERIAYSRAFYNRNVRKLNTLITQFPFIIVSYFLQVKKMEYVSIVEK